MSVSLLSRNVARKLLFIQLLAVMASGLLFSLKDPFWGISAVCGGLAVVLPNLMFIILLASSGAYTSKRPCGGPSPSVKPSGVADLRPSGGGAGRFKSGILPLIVT